ncbi:ATP-binding protein [Candidatus Peregrinibacteria bacterium]|jgi:hypothetical protein|nr:ATP-binding protein [Candidatus Peregrinibacteria bacterium]
MIYLYWLLGIIGVTAITWLIIFLYGQKQDFNRSLDMVFLLVRIPRKDSKEDIEKTREMYSSGNDFKEAVGVMAHFLEQLSGISSEDLSQRAKRQEFLSFEYAVQDKLINFYIVCPNELADILEKQITGFYPDCYLERVEDYNIFHPGSKIAVRPMRFNTPSKPWRPIRTYKIMNSDSLNSIINVMSKFEENEGAAIQIMMRPIISTRWQEKGQDEAKELFSGKKGGKGFVYYLNPFRWFSVLLNIFIRGDKANELAESPDQSERTTPLTDEQVKAIEEKCAQPGFQTAIRIVASASTKRRANILLNGLYVAFSQYSASNCNGLTKVKYFSSKRFVMNYIYRTMKRTWRERITLRKMILTPDEIASVFHVPDIRYNNSPVVNWMNYKLAPAPNNVPKEGLLLGENVYRGVRTPIYMKHLDRFRHFYVIGQTGTGKSSIFQVMIRQDLKNGNGICVIDPHGDLVESVLPFVPRERADDVIYFNPSDLERPMGLNLLEAGNDAEMDLVALEAMNIMIKMFDEEVFGPRIQDYFRNGCLTLMADKKEGGALTDIVRLFTDDAFQAYKVRRVTNPIVKSFWTEQMAKTGAREKAEMIPYFAAKFGQFITNAMMRNIIGQTKSSFDFGKVMQEGKILLMNLSKGETGDINSKLLGLIITSKIQMAAMQRQKIPQDQRRAFYLYIDEFQNYVTDSIESILSEARKYRLGLNLAHQYIAQIDPNAGGGGRRGGSAANIKDAVFGNVGSIMCYKIGATDAEYMAKEMAPVFSEQDLVNMDKFKSVMKLSIDTQPSKPFSIIPTNPYLVEGDTETGEAIKQLSRLKYGRDRDFVSRQIIRRIGLVPPDEQAKAAVEKAKGGK